VSYWVDHALGQGEIPRDPSLSHVKWMKWLGSRLNGKRAHDIQGVIVSHFGCLCRGCVVPSSSMHFFQAHQFPFIFLSLYFISI
jgi:hypothetical protein